MCVSASEAMTSGVMLLVKQVLVINIVDGRGLNNEMRH